VTALALLGAMIAGGREARAGLGLVITGSEMPGTGDPPWTSIYTVSVNPGFSIKFGDSFTIENVPGMTLLSLLSAQQPENFPGVIWVPSINQSWAPYPFSSNLTWTFLGLTPYNNPSTATQPEVIGQFAMTTTVSFDHAPVPGGTSVFYSYSINGGHQTSDPNNPPSFAITDLTSTTLAVPEPSSSTIVLLTGGTAALSGLVVRTRRRRLARAA
jgi:hypothetical protein